MWEFLIGESTKDDSHPKVNVFLLMHCFLLYKELLNTDSKRYA